MQSETDDRTQVKRKTVNIHTLDHDHFVGEVVKHARERLVETTKDYFQIIDACLRLGDDFGMYTTGNVPFMGLMGVRKDKAAGPTELHACASSLFTYAQGSTTLAGPADSEARLVRWAATCLVRPLAHPWTTWEEVLHFLLPDHTPAPGGYPPELIEVILACAARNLLVTEPDSAIMARALAALGGVSHGRINQLCHETRGGKRILVPACHGHITASSARSWLRSRGTTGF